MRKQIATVVRKDINGDLTVEVTDRLGYISGDAQFFPEPIPRGTCAIRPILASELVAKPSRYPRGAMLLVCRDHLGNECRAIIKMPPLRRTNLASNIALAIQKVLRFDRALGAKFAVIHHGGSSSAAGTGQASAFR